jgi:hypothetical protein
VLRDKAWSKRQAVFKIGFVPWESAIVHVLLVHKPFIPVAQPLRDSFAIRSAVPGPIAICQALVPPSTFRLGPVTNAASGLASQATSPAISSPDP